MLVTAVLSHAQWSVYVLTKVGRQLNALTGKEILN